MSLREAIRFLEAAATDAALREQLRRSGYGLDMEELSALAADAGYTFTPAELHRVFVNDWQLRRRFFPEDPKGPGA
jgi:predicted ribosomally synthesized peptide with nif11-like leader